MELKEFIGGNKLILTRFLFITKEYYLLLYNNSYTILHIKTEYYSKRKTSPVIFGLHLNSVILLNSVAIFNY